MPVRFHIDAPHTTAELLAPALIRHRNAWTRSVEVSRSSADDVVLHGHVTSYYHKQLAQEVCRAAYSHCRIHNELVVAQRTEVAMSAE